MTRHEGDQAGREGPRDGLGRRDAQDPEAPGRRRRPDRVGDLLPEAARRLGLERELRLARAIATWDALIAERVPAAVGMCRLLGVEGEEVVVAVDEPIAAAELRSRALELLDAFEAAPGGSRARRLRLVGGDGRSPRGDGTATGPRV